MSPIPRRGESTKRPGSAEPGESTAEMGHRGESADHVETLTKERKAGKGKRLARKHRRT